jgi:hypothetical protein
MGIFENTQNEMYWGRGVVMTKACMEGQQSWT